jgi:hypothetical protein
LGGREGEEERVLEVEQGLWRVEGEGNVERIPLLWKRIPKFRQKIRGNRKTVFRKIRKIPLPDSGVVMPVEGGGNE